MILLPRLPESVEAGKIFSWNIDDLIRRLCPVCQSDQARKICVRPDGLFVHRCQICELVYLPDIPGDDDINRFYEKYCDHKGYDEFSPNAKPFGVVKLIRAAKSHFGLQILNSFGGLNECKICEIGSSFGSFLQLARFCGAFPTGVELDSKARLSVINNLGIPSFADINEIQLDQDVFCAYSVFEHLANPREILKKIYDKLSNDGRLLLSMPNGGNLDDVGPVWAGFRVDLEHLNYFCVKTLSKLLSDNGFFVEQYWHINQLVTNRGDERIGMNKFLKKLIFSDQKYFRTGEATVVILARKV